MLFCPSCDGELVESTSERGDFFCPACATPVKTDAALALCRWCNDRKTSSWRIRCDVCIEDEDWSWSNGELTADFDAIYETFRNCTTGDTVQFVSYYRVYDSDRQEYFEYTGEAVEANELNGMPGIAIGLPSDAAAPQARIVSALRADRSLDVRFVDEDGVWLGGRAISLSIAPVDRDENETLEGSP